MRNWLSTLIFSLFVIVCSTANAGYPVNKDKVEKEATVEVTKNPDNLIEAVARGKTSSVLKSKFQDLKKNLVAGDYRAGGGGWGIASLICGLLSFIVLGLPLSLCAVIFGAIGMNKRNRGLAIAGFILGVIGLVVMILFIAALAAVA